MTEVKKILVLVFAFSVMINSVKAQSNYFNEVQLKVDNSNFFLSTDTLMYRGEMHLPFQYEEPNEIGLFKIFPKKSVLSIIENFVILPSDDYELLDSVYLLNEEYYQVKVKFKNLNESQFLKLFTRITFNDEKKEVTNMLNLLPYNNTFAELRIQDNHLFVGEEKAFEISSNNFQNISITNKWIEDNGIDYKTVYENGKLILYVLPSKTGNYELSIPIQLKNPYINYQKNISFELPSIQQKFVIKPSRLRFLSLDKNEVEITSPNHQQIAVQIDNHAGLQLNKTYRIEDQEERGGELVAEIFLRRYLNNNKMLAWLRTYNYHQQTDGYLYIKDGDVAEFITNMNIIPQTRVEKVSLLKEGKDWNSNLTVNPGELIEVKLEGQSLHKANFNFPNVEILGSDSLNNNPNKSIFKIKIPLSILDKRIEIMDGNNSTGFELKISESQKPRNFDFITVNYGEGNQTISEINKPVLYENTIQDVVIDYNADKIDQNNNLYGKQIIDLEITITNKSNTLIEIQKIEGLIFCPGENSPRYNFYNSADCKKNPLQLNQILRNKTYDLPEWSKIQLKFKHDKSKYGGNGYEKTIEIYNKKLLSFDIEVTFPAGLIEISKPEEGSDNVGNLTGISMAALAQFSFYHKKKIARYLPYKVGMGFLAINAFDFNADETQRDLGIVILGSLYPTTKDVKLTFPLYFGGGYYLNKERLFFVIGPGIRLRL